MMLRLVLVAALVGMASARSLRMRAPPVPTGLSKSDKEKVDSSIAGKLTKQAQAQTEGKASDMDDAVLATTCGEICAAHVGKPTLADLEAAKGHAENLDKALKAKSEELKGLEAKATQLLTDLKKSQDDAAAAEKRAGDLTSKLNEAQKALGDKKAQAKKSAADLVKLHEAVTQADNALKEAQAAASNARAKADAAADKYMELEQLKKVKSEKKLQATLNKNITGAIALGKEQSEIVDRQNKLIGDMAGGVKEQEDRIAAAEAHNQTKKDVAAGKQQAKDDESAVSAQEQHIEKLQTASKAEEDAKALHAKKISAHEEAIKQNDILVKEAQENAKQAEDAAKEAKKNLDELKAASEKLKSDQSCKPACMSAFKTVKAGMAGQSTAPGKYGYLAGMKVYKSTLQYAVREGKNWGTQTAATTTDAKGKVVTPAAPATPPPPAGAAPPPPASPAKGKKL